VGDRLAEDQIERHQKRTRHDQRLNDGLGVVLPSDQESACLHPRIGCELVKRILRVIIDGVHRRLPNITE
jgi:hypothetical protein